MDTYSSIGEDLVGMDSRMEKVIELVGLGMDDAHVVGIWGMGGIVHMIRNMVCRKKVLIMLDDVDESTNLENLVGEHNCLNSGNRIIITTRNKHVLTSYDITHIYEVEELREDEAMELFKSKAFGKYQQIEGYQELILHAINYAKGVPLALKVLGSFLCGQNKDKWESSLNRLKESPTKEVQELRPKAFAKMSNLRFLKICCMHLSEELKYLSNKLRYVDWLGYPKKYMPSTFPPEHLVELHLTYSSIEQLWEGTMHLGKLRIMNLSHSTYLTKSPDFTGVPNLERLILEGCTDWTATRQLPSSIGLLKNLGILTLKGCKGISKLEALSGLKVHPNTITLPDFTSGIASNWLRISKTS
ncbi:hypothetical protein ACSBR1_027877 [Camellia fascicularis]